MVERGREGCFKYVLKILLKTGLTYDLKEKRKIVS